jgi:hypothetical protein
MDPLLVRGVLISNLQVSGPVAAVSNLQGSVPVAAVKIETRVRAQRNLVSSSLKIGAGSVISASSPTTPHRVDLVRTTIDKRDMSNPCGCPRNDVLLNDKQVISDYDAFGDRVVSFLNC